MSIQLSTEDDALLQAIDLNRVGSIVNDFEVFFSFIDEGLPVSDKLKSITGKNVIKLNQLMSNPLQVDLKRPPQASYPNINGLYLLGLSSGLIKTQLKAKKWYLVQNQTLYKKWDLLSNEQKYLNLLTTWLTACPAIIEEGEFNAYPLYFAHQCLSELSITDWIKPEQIQLDFSRNDRLFNLALAHMFEFLELKQAEIQNKWAVEQIKLTPLGLATSRLLCQEVGQIEMIQNYSDSVLSTFELPANTLEFAIVPYFPHWSYLSPCPEPKPAGRYTLHLTITGYVAQATFSISHYATLHELALFILEQLVEFDTDHLYRFHYQDARYQSKILYHPELYQGEDECKYADEVTLQDINFEPHQIFRLVYDLSDRWELNLEVINFIEGGENEPPEIIETQGEPPKQYGYYEDGKADDDEKEQDEKDCEFD